MILGVDVYGKLLQQGVQSFPVSNVTAQDTYFG